MLGYENRFQRKEEFIINIFCELVPNVLSIIHHHPYEYGTTQEVSHNPNHSTKDSI